MPIFAYRSTTMEGIVTEGVIEAADERSAVERLKNAGVIPLEVRAPREGRPQGDSGLEGKETGPRDLYGRALRSAGGRAPPR